MFVSILVFSLALRPSLQRRQLAQVASSLLHHLVSAGHFHWGCLLTGSWPEDISYFLGHASTPSRPLARSLLTRSHTGSLSWAHGLSHTTSLAWSHSWAHLELSWTHGLSHSWAHAWSPVIFLGLVSKVHLSLTSHHGPLSTADINVGTLVPGVHPNDTIATVHRLALFRRRIAFDDALDTVAGLVVVLGVDPLDVFNIFDELLVGILARLNREVRHVRLERLRIGLDEAVDFHEGEERAHCYSAKVNMEGAALLLDTDELVKDADLDQALVRNL